MTGSAAPPVAVPSLLSLRTAFSKEKTQTSRAGQQCLVLPEVGALGARGGPRGGRLLPEVSQRPPQASPSSALPPAGTAFLSRCKENRVKSRQSPVLRGTGRARVALRLSASAGMDVQVCWLALTLQ